MNDTLRKMKTTFCCQRLFSAPLKTHSSLFITFLLSLSSSSCPSSSLTIGMSVSSGRFFGDKMSFVGGAPRSNGVG